MIGNGSFFRLSGARPFASRPPKVPPLEGGEAVSLGADPAALMEGGPRAFLRLFGPFYGGPMCLRLARGCALGCCLKIPKVTGPEGPGAPAARRLALGSVFGA